MPLLAAQQKTLLYAKWICVSGSSICVLNQQAVEKEQASHCCTADVCLCQSVNQLYKNNKKWPNLFFFPLLVNQTTKSVGRRTQCVTVKQANEACVGRDDGDDEDDEDKQGDFCEHYGTTIDN